MAGQVDVDSLKEFISFILDLFIGPVGMAFGWVREFENSAQETAQMLAWAARDTRILSYRAEQYKHKSDSLKAHLAKFQREQRKFETRMWKVVTRAKEEAAKTASI